MKLRWWIVGYFLAMAVVLLSPFASGSPDGLERVAEDKGYIETAQDAPYQIIADYVFPGIANEAVATILAGWIGVTIVYLMIVGLAYLMHRRTAARGHA
jgi:hypothetical protein